MITSLSSSAQESKFKALFIYKFSQYVEWPDGSKEVTIGVVGKTDVHKERFIFLRARIKELNRIVDGASACVAAAAIAAIT